MQLIVLGSNGTFPTAGRATSGYLLGDRGSFLWIDAGAGTFERLLARIDPTALVGLAVSHIHVDHSVDVMPLYHWLRFSGNSAGQLDLVLPSGAFERLSAYVNPGGQHLRETFNVIVDPESLELGGFKVSVGTAIHPVPTMQFRVEAGDRVVAYSADTGPGSDLEILGHEADLMIAEATFQGTSKDVDHHLTAAEAGEAASVAGARRLMLTHIHPRLDPEVSIAEAATRFDGEIMVATPGLEVEI